MEALKAIFQWLFEEGLITKRFLIFILIIGATVALTIWGKMEVAVSGNILISVIHFYRDELKAKGKE